MSNKGKPKEDSTTSFPPSGRERYVNWFPKKIISMVKILVMINKYNT